MVAATVNVSMLEQDFLLLFWPCAWLVNVKEDRHKKYQVSPKYPLDGRALSQIGSSSASQVCVARELNTLHEQQIVKKKNVR